MSGDRRGCIDPGDARGSVAYRADTRTGGG